MKPFKHAFFIGIFSILFGSQIVYTSAIITGFIKKNKPASDILTPEHLDFKTVSQALQQPYFVTQNKKELAIKHHDGQSGIPVSYLGYFTVTNHNGQFSFPRKQQSEMLLVLITEKVNPAFMIGPTLIHHWETIELQPAKLYQIIRKKNNEMNVYYFEINEVSLPKNNHIPLNTIIMYADPTTISIPTGIVLNNYSSNFILPDFICNNDDNNKNSLYTLSIKQYFEQINIESKNDKPNVVTIVTNR